MYVLSDYENWICQEIVACAFKVHSGLGPGLLEKVYEACLSHELKKKNIQHRRQVELPIFYDGIRFEEGLRIDILVENMIIIEIKAVDLVNPLWQAQVLSHLKLSGNNIGFLINFNVALIKNGIRRFCID